MVTYLDLPDDEVSNAFEAMQPLSAIEARKMEVLSSRYEQRIAIVTPKPTKNLKRIKRSMSVDSGKQAQDIGGSTTGKKTSNIPASIDEFMSNSTAETLQIYFWFFLLFRLFDGLKPFPIDYIDKNFKNTFGILFDDILAGFYVVISLILFMGGKTLFF